MILGVACIFAVFKIIKRYLVSKASQLADPGNHRIIKYSILKDLDNERNRIYEPYRFWIKEILVKIYKCFFIPYYLVYASLKKSPENCRRRPVAVRRAERSRATVITLQKLVAIDIHFGVKYRLSCYIQCYSSPPEIKSPDSCIIPSVAIIIHFEFFCHDFQ